MADDNSELRLQSLCLQTTRFEQRVMDAWEHMESLRLASQLENQSAEAQLGRMEAPVQGAMQSARGSSSESCPWHSGPKAVHLLCNLTGTLNMLQSTHL